MEQDQKLIFKNKVNQSGQAVVEYVLLLVIVVAVVVGIGKGFGTLNDFLSRYIGDYTACLMEYGELPSLGIKDTDLDRHMSGTGKKCNQQYAAFTFVDGRPSNSSSSSSGKGGSNGSSNFPNSQIKQFPSGKSPTASSSSSSASKSSSDTNASDSSDSTKDSLGKDGSGGSKKPVVVRPGVQASGYATIDGQQPDGANKVRVVDEDEDGEGGRKKRKNKNYSLTRPAYDSSKYHAITGRMQQEMEKRLKKSTRAPSSLVRTIVNGDSRFTPFTKAFVPQSFKKPKVEEDNSSGFGFGYFLRWILIAGMVIAIIIFFGGQIMNYSNSQE